MNTIQALNTLRGQLRGQLRGPLRVVGDCDNPWFNATDICNILEYTNFEKSIHTHVKPEENKTLSELKFQLDDIQEEGNEDIYINETGFYRLIMNSNSIMADSFKDLVFDKVLPTFRKHRNVDMDDVCEQLENLKLETAIQAHIIKIQDQKLADEEEKRQRAERKALRISKIIKHANTRENKEQWIYIATTDLYAKERIFKIGSTEKLAQRIEGYQTGRPKEDRYYYAFVKKVYNSKDLDYHIQRLLSDYKHSQKGEMYTGIKFKDLCEIVTVICDNYDETLQFIYQFIRNKLPTSLEDVDDEPPPIVDINTLTNDNDILLSGESVKNIIQDILNTVQGHVHNNVVVYYRKDLLQALGNTFSCSKKRPLWEATKKAVGWKSSQTVIKNGDNCFMIKY
jgi:prophage antirepressor-like protein